MISSLFNKDIVDILTVFSLSPGSRFQRKEIQEKTKMHNVNLDHAITILLNTRLLQKEKRLLSLNIEKAMPIINLVSQEYKTLKQLPLLVYFSITSIVSLLTKMKKIQVYLFGSHAKLVYHESSDIDLAIITALDITNEKREIAKICQKIEKKYGTKIDIHYFSPAFYHNKKDPLVKEIIKHGVQLL